MPTVGTRVFSCAQHQRQTPLFRTPPRARTSPPRAAPPRSFSCVFYSVFARDCRPNADVDADPFPSSLPFPPKNSCLTAQQRTLLEARSCCCEPRRSPAAASSAFARTSSISASLVAVRNPSTVIASSSRSGSTSGSGSGLGSGAGSGRSARAPPSPWWPSRLVLWFGRRLLRNLGGLRARVRTRRRGGD